MIHCWQSDSGLDMLIPAMSRDNNALSRMDVLVLSSLARVPMHGYELKLELRFRHAAIR